MTSSMLLPTDPGPGYDEERSGFQTAQRHRPAAVVAARTAEDVRAAVAYAARRGLPVAVQATGHGLSVPATDGVLISTRAMDGVRVDPAARTAWLEAGVRFDRVIAEAARHGLAPLNGSSPGVGAVSYTLGGGIGILARRYGFAADHVRRIEVVTADGRLRRVTAERDPDLFWALRGGRDNFGVVTGLEVGLVPVTRLYGGQLVFGADLVPALLDAYPAWAAGLPDELTSSIQLIAYPDLPQLPEHLRGTYAAGVRIAHTGSAEEGERLVAPLRALGPRVTDSLREMPYADSHTIHQDPADPHAYDGDNALLSEADPAALREVAELTGPAAPAMCVVQLGHLGGALARPPAVPGAVGHRGAGYLLRLLSPLGEDPAGPAGLRSVRALHARALSAVAPWTVGRSLNFLFGDHGHARVRTAYEPADYERLVALKAAYDPANTFRLNHNLPPRGVADDTARR